MQIAQRLYEGLDTGGETAGLITYMRTDGVQMAPEAIHAARDAIKKEFGEKYLPEKPRYYSTKAKNAKSAHTKFELIESYGSFASLIRLDLLTGRTHQIRVHASDAGHPLLGDMLYAGRRRPHKTWPEAARTFERQALHSEQLTLTLPNGKRKTFKAPWPADLTALRKALKNPEKTHA